MKCQLQREIMAAFPNLTDDDFAYHASDMYVVVVGGLWDWLKQTHPNIRPSSFVSQAGSNWNGAGRLCYDIPFAAIDELSAARK